MLFVVILNAFCDHAVRATLAGQLVAVACLLVGCPHNLFVYLLGCLLLHLGSVVVLSSLASLSFGSLLVLILNLILGFSLLNALLLMFGWSLIVTFATAAAALSSFSSRRNLLCLLSWLCVYLSRCVNRRYFINLLKAVLQMGLQLHHFGQFIFQNPSFWIL